MPNFPSDMVYIGGVHRFFRGPVFRFCAEVLALTVIDRCSLNIDQHA